MFQRSIFIVLLITLGGCQTSKPSKAETAAPIDPWSSDFRPPGLLRTDQVHLEPLTPDHAEMDHAAFMSSREHLHRTLHWGSWPREDATVEQNREDLARHEKEFDAREAYAYTVLRPDRSACVGCIYINPAEGESDVSRRTPRGAGETDAPAAALEYWVIESEVDRGLDEHLLRSIMGWIEAEWPFDTVICAIHPENVRGLEIAEQLGFQRRPDQVEGRWVLVWVRE